MTAPVASPPASLRRRLANVCTTPKTNAAIETSATDSVTQSGNEKSFLARDVNISGALNTHSSACWFHCRR